MIRLAAPLLLLLGAAPAAAQQTVLLSGPAGGGVGSGEISPDGTRFAYELRLPDSSVQIWLLDLRTRATSPATRGPGKRRGPAWSPDGSRIAFVRGGFGGVPRARPAPGAPSAAAAPAEREGIWVVDLEGGRERAVFLPQAEYGFVYDPRWAGPDSIQFRYNLGTLTGGGKLWIVAADGTGARPVQHPTRLPVRSPSAVRRAYFAGCCSTVGHGLWIASPAQERCVAGPMGRGVEVGWSADGRMLFFTGTASSYDFSPGVASPYDASPYDSVRALWSADVTRGGARRIVTPAGALSHLSVSATGVLALEIRTAGDSVRLWLVRDPGGLPRADEAIPACRTPYRALVEFARSEGLSGTLQIRESFRLPEYDFAVYRVGYGFSPNGSHFRTAARVGDHIGWIGGPCRIGFMGDRSCRRGEEASVTFRLRPDEAFLWSETFLKRLGAAQPGWPERWVGVLLRDPDLPAAAFESLLEQEAFDAQLVEDRRVRNRPGWLLRLWERHEGRDRVGSAAFEALWRQGAEVVRHPGAPSRLLHKFAVQVPRRGTRAGDQGERTDEAERTEEAGRTDRTDPADQAAAIGRALLAHPEAGRDPDILVHLARLPPSVDSAVFRTAGRRLLDDPSVSADVLERVVANLAADPELADRLFRDPRVRGSRGALLALARTPWRDWTVARRARRILEDRQEREAERSAGEGRRLLLPFVRVPGPDSSGRQSAWRPARRSSFRCDGEPFYGFYGPRLHDLLWRIDPVFGPGPPIIPPRPARGAVERTLCSVATCRETGEADLKRIAESAVYATSTRVASCLLDNPRVRESVEILRILASMIDVNEDPRFPGPGAPTIAEVRARAKALLERIDAP